MWMRFTGLNRQVEEVLYPAMEDYAIDIMIGKGSIRQKYSSGSSEIHLGRCDYKGRTSDSTVKGPFGVVHHLEYYTVEELTTIIVTFCGCTACGDRSEWCDGAGKTLKRDASSGKSLLKRVRDFAQVKYDGKITEKVAVFALDLLEVDRHGLDQSDRTILRTIIEKFAGGPVGLDTLAASLGEDAGTLEDVYEPYLFRMVSEPDIPGTSGDRRLMNIWGLLFRINRYT